jgi:hypothetical protein
MFLLYIQEHLYLIQEYMLEVVVVEVIYLHLEQQGVQAVVEQVQQNILVQQQEHLTQVVAEVVEEEELEAQLLIMEQMEAQV